MPSRSTLHPLAVPLALAVVAVWSTVVLLRRPDPGRAIGTCLHGMERMTRLELVFGMGRKGAAEISDAEWQAFLDAEITPRFPDGLTVLSGYGQWRSAGGDVAKETSRVLLVWHKPGGEAERHAEAIRATWKARHAQESVLRADSTACVNF